MAKFAGGLLKSLVPRCRGAQPKEAPEDFTGAEPKEVFISKEYSPQVVADVAEWGMHGRSTPVFAEYLALCHAANFAPLIDPSPKDIGKDDALIIVDVQNDFVPKDQMNTHGRLAAPEGNDICEQIVPLAKLVAQRGGVVVATRDYHPAGHCSFKCKGGGVDPHCIQGNGGSHFYDPVAKCLEGLLKEKRRVEIVFKGFHEDVESFGSLTYSEVPPSDRGEEFAMTKDCPEERLYGCDSLVDWTGSFCMKCSNLEFEGRFDVNAPPDILAAWGRKSLADTLREHGVKRVFVCGLVFDLCVLDTSLNSKKAGFDTFTVMDACRPIHVPEVGFVNRVEGIRAKLDLAGVRLVPTSALVPGFRAMNPMKRSTE